MWNAKIDVSGDSREHIVAAFQAALTEIERGFVQSAFGGDDGYAYMFEVNKPQEQ